MSKRGTNQPIGDYPVGYCKPPAANQFKPGKSGHGKRPVVDSHNETSTIEQVLKEKRTVIVRGKKRRMCNEEFMIRKQNDKAAGGDLKSTIYLLSRRDESRASRAAQPQPHFDMSLLTDEEVETITEILTKAEARGKGEPLPDTGL